MYKPKTSIPGETSKKHIEPVPIWIFHENEKIFNIFQFCWFNSDIWDPPPLETPQET